MIGGAADLVESTKTVFEGAGEFSRVHAGRNVPFGIREHAMGAIVNGAAAHGGIVKPYGSTFLIFSDYMRGAVRLSALMGLPVVWVWTHDSVGLGEDGPTHQPIEHYASLRAIPDLWVIRPGDANETRRAHGGWRSSARTAPWRCCSRARASRCSTAPRLAAAEELERGGYVLWDSGDAAAAPELILISTGAEVATDARGRAEAGRRRATNVRVVSMPCMELFEAQTQEYRDEVLPPAVHRAPGGRAGREHELVEVGRHRRRRARPRPLRRLGAGCYGAGGARLQRREHRSRAPARCSARRPKETDLRD